MRYMIRKVLAGVGLAIGGGLLSTPMQAQIHEVSRTPLADVTQLTFGHLCGDRFVVRNDGPRAIDLQYGLAGGTEHADLKIGGRESVELESTGRQAVELWMNGKRIAKSTKERRSREGVSESAAVAVTPLRTTEDVSQSRVRFDLGYGYPYYDAWGFRSYGMMG